MCVFLKSCPSSRVRWCPLSERAPYCADRERVSPNKASVFKSASCTPQIDGVFFVILSDFRWSADPPHDQVTGVSHATAAAKYKPVENEKAQTLRKVSALLFCFT